MTPAERRAYPRVRFSGLVVVRCAQSDVPCGGIDLSESGVRVRPREAVALKEQRVELLLGVYEGGWLPLSARVVRIEKGRRSPRWALSFEPPPPESQRALRRIIAALTAAQLAVAESVVPTARSQTPTAPPRTPTASVLAPLPVEGPKAAAAAHELDDDPTPRETTRNVLPEVMNDLAAKDPTARLTVEELEALLALIE